MLTTLKTRILAGTLLLIAGLVVSTATTAAAAEPGIQIRLRPTFPSQPFTPRLGFEGHYDYGHGMHVDRVVWGSLASKIGLEEDDVVVAIDGQRIRSLGHYQSLLRSSGARATIYIEDHRTGRIIARTVWLNGGHNHNHDHDHGHGHDHSSELVLGL